MSYIAQFHYIAVDALFMMKQLQATMYQQYLTRQAKQRLPTIPLTKHLLPMSHCEYLNLVKLMTVQLPMPGQVVLQTTYLISIMQSKH